MSLTVVAIPRQDDFVWNVSSEKVPHLTILFLGENASESDITHITEFIQHTSELTLTPFGLDVDYRGDLGTDNADVLFFNKSGKGFEDISNFRGALLQDKRIRLAYESVQQFPDWTPHLTLGFPETPAKKDERDYPGFFWMMFDKIAFWTGDSEGPEFRLKSPEMSEVMSMSFAEIGMDFLEHHGVKGMKWGVRRGRTTGGRMKSDHPRKTVKHLTDAELKAKVDRLRLEDQFINLHRSTTTSDGRKWTNDLIKNQGKTAVGAVVGTAVTFAVQRALKAHFGDKP